MAQPEVKSDADLEEVKFVRGEEEQSRGEIDSTQKPKSDKGEASKDHSQGNTAAACSVVASHRANSHGADAGEKKVPKKVIEIDSSQCLVGYDIDEHAGGDSDDGEEPKQTVEEMTVLRERLRTRLSQIERMPFKSPEFERSKTNLSNEIWILTGVIDHNYPRQALEYLAAMHKNIGKQLAGYKLLKGLEGST